MRKRSCGECNVCCVTVEVEELSKPAGTPCPLLAACNGSGCCGAYKDRPSACHVYTCGWIDGLLPANWRPDLCGILFEAGHVDWPHRITLMMGFEIRPGAIDANRRLLATIFPSGTAALIVPFEAHKGAGLKYATGEEGEPEYFGPPDDVQGLRAFFESCKQNGTMTLRMADADVLIRT